MLAALFAPSPAPSPPPAAADPMAIALGALGLVGFILLAVAISLAIVYWVDVRRHQGVSVFKRRLVLKSGTPAEAKILSCDAHALTWQGAGGMKDAYSIVYEVIGAAGESFRVKGIEVMDLGAADANGVRLGATVPVKFDARDRTVVLVRADAKAIAREQEASRRAREEALLRAPPR